MPVSRQSFEIDANAYSFDCHVERAQGCHLSDIIKYMSDRRYTDRTEGAKQASWAAGFLVERALAHHATQVDLGGYRGGLIRPGELMWCHQCDKVIAGLDAAREHVLASAHVGIFGNPDALLVREWMLKEWKCTKRSMRRAGADRVIEGKDGDREVPEHPQYEHIEIGFWEWVVQIKGYCWMIGKWYNLPMLRALLEVLFLSGDYGVTTMGYETQRYWFRFDQRQLDDQWDALVAQAIDGGLLTVEVA